MSDFRVEGEVVIDTSKAEKNIDDAASRISKRLQEQLRVVEEIAGKSSSGQIRVLNVDDSIESIKKLEKEAKGLDDFFRNKRQIPPPDITAFLDRVHKATDEARKAIGAISDADVKGPKGFLKGISDAIANADEKLKSVGLSFRGVSVLLGAGLATGVAGLFRIGERIFEVAGRINEVIGAEDLLLKQTEQTFGQGGKRVEEFANTVGARLGGARDDLLKTANAFGVLATQLELGDKLSTQFSIDFTEAAQAIAKTRGLKIEDVQAALTQAINGNVKALAELGITVTDFDNASEKAFGLHIDQLTEAQRLEVVHTLAIENASDAVREFGEQSKSAWQKFIDGLKGALSTSAQEEFDRFFKTLSDGQHLIATQQVQLHDLSTTQLKDLRDLAEAAGDDRTVEVIDKIIKKRNADADAIDRQNHSLRTQAEIQERQIQLFKQSSQLQEQAIDANKRLVDAQIEGDKRVQDAEEQLARTREDNARKRDDLELRNDRSIADSHLRLNRALQDAELADQERTLKRADREQKFQETQLKVERVNRDAREKLEDALLDHRRKLDDDQRRIDDARLQRAQRILDAELSLGQALLKGDVFAERSSRLALQRAEQDKGLADAQRKLREDREDDETKIARLIRERNETQQDGIRELQQAERTRAEAILQENKDILSTERQLQDARTGYDRAIEDAARSLDDLEVQQNRALFDAKKRIRDAEDARDKAIEAAATAFERLAVQIGINVDKLHELVDSLIVAQDIFKGDIGDVALGFGPPHGATGFRNFRGGLAVVGEDGPELVNLPRGSDVFTNQDFRKFMAGMSGGQTNNITINKVADDEEATAHAVSSRLAREVA